MSQPEVYVCPLPPEPPSHLLPHPSPPGCHRAPGLSSLRHTANSHWLSILHLVMCMFQCNSPNSSHPLLPLLCPPSLYASLFLKPSSADSLSTFKQQRDSSFSQCIWDRRWVQVRFLVVLQGKAPPLELPEDI